MSYKGRMHAYIHIVKNQSFPIYYLTGQKKYSTYRKKKEISALPPLKCRKRNGERE